MKSWFLLLFVSGAALADDAALLHCRTLADGPLRLACYNAIPLGVSAPAASVAGVAAAPAASAAAVPAAQTRAELERNFGNEQKIFAEQTAQLKSIDSRIEGKFYGWVANQRIHLANGQVWKIADDSSEELELTDPKVTVERGLLGAIFLDIDGARMAPKVKRVK